jgi:hypothetical protein
MINNHEIQKSGRGGSRPNAGRPKGSTNKITPEKLLNDFEQQAGMPFEEFVNQRILEAHMLGDRELVKQYVLGLAKYVVQDKQEIAIDHTTLGESLKPSYSFVRQELPEWPITVTTNGKN